MRLRTIIDPQEVGFHTASAIRDLPTEEQTAVLNALDTESRECAAKTLEQSGQQPIESPNELKLFTDASARRIAHACLEVRDNKRKEILSMLNTDARIAVIKETIRIREKREKSI